jgi:hypothetical protein
MTDMTDVKIIERRLAQTTDRLDRCAALIEAKTHEVARLGYDLHVDNKDAEPQLRKLREERSRLRDEKETLTGAVAKLQKLLADARKLEADADARGHTKRLLELIGALEEMAGSLDACFGTYVKGSMGGLRHEVGPKNPPLLDRCGECIGQIFLAMKAIDDVTRSDLRKGVVWPPGPWSKGHVADLRKVFERVVLQYCSPRLPSARNFAGLITALADSIKAALAQHEQTNREAA